VAVAVQVEILTPETAVLVVVLMAGIFLLLELEPLGKVILAVLLLLIRAAEAVVQVARVLQELPERRVAAVPV
jgi:hypothetical protein